MQINIYNFLETDNKWQTFLSSITARIKSTECNGKQCYEIKGFLSTTSLTEKDSRVYIDKDTGLYVKAIGAGQITGMGILEGNQTQLGYLYPKTTDFIFSVIGEEMGFIVAGGVIILNVLIITKAIQVAKGIRDEAGAYVATGIAGIFLFHTLENIGMTMGLLPITGVPLLFVSYGGSSMVTSFICIGILLNISSQRRTGMFNK